MTIDPQKFIICPNLIIEKDKKFLLLRRADWAPLFPGHWHCVTGKIERGECPRKAIIREAYEEVGLKIEPQLKSVIHVTGVDFINPDLIWEDLSFFFHVYAQDEPINKEPRLHDAMEWFDGDNLPHPMIPVVKYGIHCYQMGYNYSEFRHI